MYSLPLFKFLFIPFTVLNPSSNDFTDDEEVEHIESELLDLEDLLEAFVLFSEFYGLNFLKIKLKSSLLIYFGNF